jgi:hypothetical protein
LRVKALRKVSTWQPCWSRSEAATAASRAFTSTAVPCFAAFRKIFSKCPIFEPADARGVADTGVHKI